MRTPSVALVLSIVSMAGCSSDESNPNSATAMGTGGTLATGGMKTSGGTPGSAGVPATGGTLGSGGVTTSGGSAGTGAASTNTGGTNTAGTSGATSTGGKIGGAAGESSGGATGGGAKSSGGTGTGGASGAPSSGGSGGSAPSTACTREALEAGAKTLQDALEAGDAMKMSLADAASYEENMKASMFNDGIWKSAVVVAFRRSLLDVEICESFSEIIVTEGHKYVIGANMKLEGGKVSKVANLVTDEGDWLFDADKYLMYSKAEDWSVIPEAERDTREVLINAGDAYFNLFSDKTVEVPWGMPCNRLEGGDVYTNGTCDVGVPDGITFTDKHWVVDRDLGTAVGIVRFGGANGLPDSHMFRSLKGRIRYVHTITVCSQPNCGM